jgi:glutaredoxin
MRVTIRIPRPAGCPCCATEDAADAMRLKAFIEQVKNIFGEKAQIEILFDSSKDTPNVSINGKEVSCGRYPDPEELNGY